MWLGKLENKKEFQFCKVTSLKAFNGRGYKIKPGDTIFAMWYPHKKWSLFTKSAEDLDPGLPQTNHEISADAVIGVDFEEFKEV